MPIYAHTLRNHPPQGWEPLYGADGHAAKVAEIIESFRNPFAEEVLGDDKMKGIFRILGLYHDMGKASNAFQEYLLQSSKGRNVPKENHKTAAACFVWKQQSKKLAYKMMAYAFEGHHTGLPDGAALFSKLSGYEESDEALNALPPGMENLPPIPAPSLGKGMQSDEELAFALQMAVRMFHSCLIDADWLATESFMEPEAYGKRRAMPYAGMAELSACTERAIGQYEAGASGHIAALRREIHEACHGAAEKPPGVYRLNVPTGGGKTLSSLSFALAHARRYGLSRVIYVIPYTSIIDQTAAEFRRVLGEENVVEHQSNIGSENDTMRNRLSAENWDAPLIVTTSVQFFETLFASKNRRCRKLHNIAHSVIIFDEAQSLPAHLLAPCLFAMKTLQRQYGCTLVLCTATQPALGYRPRYFEIGWPQQELHSLIGDAWEARLSREMKRVEVHRLGRLSQEQLIRHFSDSGEKSALFIVNLTRQAQELFFALQGQGVEGLYHLSARMCPAHRLAMLEHVRKRLNEGLPTVLVSTRVVEAGVDVSFPVVYRDRCGLDSLAQSAGRCNRHGEAPLGHVYSYEAEGVPLPPAFTDLKHGVEAFEDAMATCGDDDPLAPETVERYFQLFYSSRNNGTKGWDQPGILDLVGRKDEMAEAWDFPEMAKRFQLIPGVQRTVLVRYGEAAEGLRTALRQAEKAGVMPSRQDFRRAQQLSVSIYEAEWERLIPLMECLHEETGLYMLAEERVYSDDVGLLREWEDFDYVI